MSLSLDARYQQYFDKIETKTKTQFTKEYNKSHKEITRIAGGKAGKKGGAAVEVKEAKDEAEGANKSEDEEESDDGEQGVLLDENEIAEIKKAKQEEKMRKKALAAMKRLGAG